MTQAVPTFHWQSQDNNTARARKRPLTYYLFAGDVLLAVAQPSESGNRYSSFTEVTGVAVHRQYLPLDEMKAALERAYTVWFEACFKDPET